MPGGSAGGDSQVISLRRADARPTSDSGASKTSSTAPVKGEQRGKRQHEREDTAKGQKPGETPTLKTGTTPPPNNAFGANEQWVREEILRAKGEVLQPEKRRLDEERARINQAIARGDASAKDQMSKYMSKLKSYSDLVGTISDGPGVPSGKVQSSTRSFPEHVRWKSTVRCSTSAAGRQPRWPLQGGCEIKRFRKKLLVSENFDTELEAVNEARKYNRKMVNIRIKVTDRNGNNVAW